MPSPNSSAIPGDAGPEPVGHRGPGAGWTIALLVLAVVLAVPFFMVDVPPVLDYPNHLARYFVLAHPDDPVLSQFYAPNWRILPNLGIDAIAMGVLRITDVHVGGRLLLALSLYAPLLGVVAYHRMVFGRFFYWPLGAAAIAYNGVFFLGFMNFLLSLGLAFAAAAAWIAWRRRGYDLAAVATGMVAAAAIFFCHIFGVLLFALLIGAAEVDPWQAGRSGACKVQDGIRTIGLIVLAMSPALALYLASPLATEPTVFGAWQGVPKLWRILTPFMTSDAQLTLLTAFAVASCVVLVWRQAGRAARLPAFAGAAAGCVRGSALDDQGR